MILTEVAGMVVNGKIQKAEIKLVDMDRTDPVFVLQLVLIFGSTDGPCGNCAFDIVLDEEVFFSNKYVCRKATPESGSIIKKVMQIAGVDSWSQIEGKYIRCVIDGDRMFSKLVGIGHIIDDIWIEK